MLVLVMALPMTRMSLVMMVLACTLMCWYAMLLYPFMNCMRMPVTHSHPLDIYTLPLYTECASAPHKPERGADYEPKPWR